MTQQAKVFTAKINAGMPAKPHLYKPLAGKENKRVWPELEPGYAIVKGEKYEWLGEGDLSEEIFETKRVSSSKKAGDSLE
jgi:hypothetical protein